jgi:hypothetical protein
LILLLLAISCSSQQQKPATDQNSAQSFEITRSPDSSAEDLAVPLCPSKFADGLQPDGIAVISSKNMTPPKELHSVESRFTDQARRAIKKKHLIPFNGIVLIGLIVDVHGDPQNLCLQKSLGYGLDANAATAVRQYKFVPATKDDKPVPVRIAIEVNYKLW